MAAFDKNMRFSTNIVPSTNGNGSLGTDTLQFDNIYVNKIYTPFSYFSNNGEMSRRFYSSGPMSSQGWFRVAKCQLNAQNHMDPFTMSFSITRGYNHRPSESYEICVTHGWDVACMLTQIGGRAHYQCLKYATIRRDETNHWAYLELYYDDTVLNGVRVNIETTTNGGTMQWEPCFENGGIGTPLGTVALTNGTSVQELTIGGHSSKVGTSIAGASAYVVASGTWTDGPSIQVPAGAWIIEMTAQYPKNDTGNREIHLKGLDVNSYSRPHTVFNSKAVQSDYTAISRMNIVEISTTHTLTCELYQNSGTALTVPCYIHAVRLT